MLAISWSLRSCSSYSFFLFSNSFSLLTMLEACWKVLLEFERCSDEIAEALLLLGIEWDPPLVLMPLLLLDIPNSFYRFFKLSGDIFYSVTVYWPKSGNPCKNCFSNASASLSILICQYRSLSFYYSSISSTALIDFILKLLFISFWAATLFYSLLIF